MGSGSSRPHWRPHSQGIFLTAFTLTHAEAPRAAVPAACLSASFLACAAPSADCGAAHERNDALPELASLTKRARGRGDRKGPLKGSRGHLYRGCTCSNTVIRGGRGQGGKRGRRRRRRHAFAGNMPSSGASEPSRSVSEDPSLDPSGSVGGGNAVVPEFPGHLEPKRSPDPMLTKIRWDAGHATHLPCTPK
eukprot:6994970-Pyramimonas_sp.AAC.1